MEETLEFCRRVLRSAGAAEEAARTALASGPHGRLEQLSAASRACQSHMALDVALPGPDGVDGLDGAIARELASAVSRLPERQRQALALRETIGLSYAELGEVIRIDTSAVGPLLARARLRLRQELRGPVGGPAACCEQRDRALRALARRHDGETLAPVEREWVSDHLADCPECGRAHAGMLEASVCYRAWRLDAGPARDEPLPTVRLRRLGTPTRGSAEDSETARAEPERPALWSRFRSALAADARR